MTSRITPAYEPRYRVAIAEQTEASPRFRFSATVGGPSGMVRVAFAPTRGQVWSLALATLRGMIALERLRKLA